jgi:hypothetical protein
MAAMAAMAAWTSIGNIITTGINTSASKLLFGVHRTGQDQKWMLTNLYE